MIININKRNYKSKYFNFIIYIKYILFVILRYIKILENYCIDAYFFINILSLLYFNCF